MASRGNIGFWLFGQSNMTSSSFFFEWDVIGQDGSTPARLLPVLLPNCFLTYIHLFSLWSLLLVPSHHQLPSHPRYRLSLNSTLAKERGTNWMWQCMALHLGHKVSWRRSWETVGGPRLSLGDTHVRWWSRGQWCFPWKEAPVSLPGPAIPHPSPPPLLQTHFFRVGLPWAWLSPTGELPLRAIKDVALWFP